MAFTGGYVVENMAIPSGKEPFNGELCRSRFTQTSNAVGCSERGTAAGTVSFRKRSSDRSRSFEKTPQRHKDSGRGHGFMVVVCREGKGVGTRGLPFSSQTNQGDRPRSVEVGQSGCGDASPAA